LVADWAWPKPQPNLDWVRVLVAPVLLLVPAPVGHRGQSNQEIHWGRNWTATHRCLTSSWPFIASSFGQKISKVSLFVEKTEKKRAILTFVSLTFA
jgi:hypothetical protein